MEEKKVIAFVGMPGSGKGSCTTYLDEKYHQVVCPNCKNNILRFEAGVIQLENLSVKCPFCKTHSLYAIKGKPTNNLDGDSVVR